MNVELEIRVEVVELAPERPAVLGPTRPLWSLYLTALPPRDSLLLHDKVYYRVAELLHESRSGPGQDASTWHVIVRRLEDWPETRQCHDKGDLLYYATDVLRAAATVLTGDFRGLDKEAEVAFRKSIAASLSTALAHVQAGILPGRADSGSPFAVFAAGEAAQAAR